MSTEQKRMFHCSIVFIVPVFCFLWCQIHWSYAELRFCIPQFGPQRMKDTDCPGGFVFKEPIVAPDCLYYAKTGDHVGKVLTTPVDLCTPNTDRIIENVGDLMEDISTLTYFMWEEYGKANETKGIFEPMSICQDECLSEWEDPHAVLAEDPPILDDFDPSTVSDDDLKLLKTMNKEMFLRLLMDDDDVDDDELVGKPDGGGFAPLPTTGAPAPINYFTQAPTVFNGERRPFKRLGRAANASNPAETIKHQSKKPVLHIGQGFLNKALHDSTTLNVIKVLSKSMKIIASACAPYIPEEFLEQVLKGMLYISQKMEDTFLDLAPDIYRRMAKTLDHCGLKRQQEFTLNGSRCGDLSLAQGIYFTKSREYWPHRLTGWSFRWGRWHPLLDATWSVIDFIQNFCFESFMQDMMMLHMFVMSLEGLFPEEIQLLWRVHPAVNNDKFWNNLLQTDDLNITMRNLDACQEAARRASPYLRSLPRPFLNLAELNKPAPPPDPSQATQVAKGWNKTISQYWERYEKLGGFQKISEEFGKCFVVPHLEEEYDMVENLRMKCP